MPFLRHSGGGCITSTTLAFWHSLGLLDPSDDEQEKKDELKPDEEYDPSFISIATEERPPNKYWQDGLDWFHNF